MQYLNYFFPLMNTWKNIELVMIVQPNGRILSHYHQFYNQNNKSFKSIQLLKGNSLSNQVQLKQSEDQQKESQQKNLIKKRMSLISKKVIQTSRKLYRESYENQLNRLFIDKFLVYYQAKHNVIIIVTVKKFSVQIFEIQQLIDKISNWFYEKCCSLNVEINLPNVEIGEYQLRQIKKISWQIANEIHEKVSSFQADQLPILSIAPQEEIVKQMFQEIGETILSRDQKLIQIGEKAYFSQKESEKIELLGFQSDSSSFKNMMQRVYSGKYQSRIPKIKKFKRQWSFMQKSVLISKQMKIKLILFYFCLAVTLSLTFMVYFGWFQDSQD